MPTFNLAIADPNRAVAFGLLAPEMHKAFGVSGAWYSYLNQLQTRLGIYSSMPLNSKHKHVIHTIGASPLLVRDRVACSWAPDSGLTYEKIEITPSELEIQSEICMQTDFSAAFNLLEQIQNNRSDWDPQLIDMVTREFGLAIAEGLMMQAVSGGIKPSEAAKAGTAANIAALWLKGRAAHNGFAKLLSGTAKDLNYFGTGVGAGNVHTDTGFTGNVVTLYDSLVEAAHSKLKTVINTGSIRLASRELMPILLVSPNVYELFSKAEAANAAVAAQNRRRIRWGYVTANGQVVPGDTAPEGSVRCLMIDRVVIVPEERFAYGDEITATQTYFAALTVAGNFNIGASFSNVDAVFGGDAGVGLVVQMGTDVKDAGKVYVQGNQLLSTAISDLNLVSATVDVFAPTASE